MCRSSIRLIGGLVPVAIAGLVVACGGPGKGEFVAACMTEQGLQGMTEEQCACAADVAKSRFSPPAYAAVVLDMQGKDEEARAIQAKLSESEQIQMVQGTGEIFGKCLLGRQGS